MAVVNEAMRQESVQQCLDRRVGRPAADELIPQEGDYLVVAHAGAAPGGQKRVEAERREAGGVDLAQIPSRSLNVQDPFVRPGADLDGGVAAPVQNEVRIAPDQAGGVDAQGEIGCEPIRLSSRDMLGRVPVIPARIHLSTFRMPSGADRSAPHGWSDPSGFRSRSC